ncbi:MAG: hypothetical protein CMJ89_12485 [Planctomycetes bacterium]|nr:hypothetical protein [Planctomycetota bacterium]
MDASKIINELCARYGVSEEFGRRIQPLVERADKVRPELKKRILEMVERSFIEEARRQKECNPIKNLDPAERKLLSTVAAVLHGWKPPLWLSHTKEKGDTKTDDDPEEES